MFYYHHMFKTTTTTIIPTSITADTSPTFAPTISANCLFTSGKSNLFTTLSGQMFFCFVLLVGYVSLISLTYFFCHILDRTTTSTSACTISTLPSNTPSLTCLLSGQKPVLCPLAVTELPPAPEVPGGGHAVLPLSHQQGGHCHLQGNTFKPCSQPQPLAPALLHPLPLPATP